MSIHDFPEEYRTAIRAYKREMARLWRNTFRTRPYYPRPKARKEHKRKTQKKREGR